MRNRLSDGLTPVRYKKESVALKTARLTECQHPPVDASHLNVSTLCSLIPAVALFCLPADENNTNAPSVIIIIITQSGWRAMVHCPLGSRRDLNVQSAARQTSPRCSGRALVLMHENIFVLSSSSLQGQTTQVQDVHTP